MRFAERRSLLDEVLGEVGRRVHRAVGGRGHPFFDEVGSGDEPGKGRERQRARVERVEQRLLVLLQVAVVRERQALERRQQTGEVADQSPRLARASSAMSGFFFCGSIDDPVA